MPRVLGWAAASGVTRVTNTTFADNLAMGGMAPSLGNYAASGLGGAIYTAGDLEMLNCTVSSNTAHGGQDIFSGGHALSFAGYGQGGGIFNNAGSLSLSYLTLANNTAAQSA